MNDSRDRNDRILIRAVETDDFEALHEIYSQPLVCQWTLQLPLTAATLWQARLAQPDADRHMLAACVDGRVVGNLGMKREANPRRRHVAGIGMGVHDAFAGRGIGQRLMEAAIELADDWLGLRRLELTVFAGNERAIRLYERCGFATEGRLRGYALQGGELTDALAMARIR